MAGERGEEVALLFAVELEFPDEMEACVLVGGVLWGDDGGHR